MKQIAKKLLQPLRRLGAQFVAPYLGGDLDQSTIHQLTEGDVTGFHFTIIDSDVETYEGYWTLSGATDSYFQGDLLSDFFLAPIDADIPWENQQTAVESASWGRIKSTFAE